MTAIPLLTTKLHPPVMSGRQVPRRRLYEMLDRGARGPLTLISAGAGSGKSTLLVDWLEQQDRHAAWLSLDEADNDLGRFLNYLTGSLRTLFPQLAGDLAMALRSPEPLDPEWVLTTWLNALASGPGCDAVLILDDYHLIHNDTIHRAMAFLIEHLPPALRLIVATRSDPPWSLSRMRVRGQLLEIRADALGFTERETGEFFRQTMEIALDDPQVAALNRRTEGWIAGLQLAALSLRGRAGQAGEWIDGFAGHHRYVLEYLTDEVLEQQSADDLEFMLKTSILDRFCGSLCQATLGGEDAHERLAHLDGANLFLIALDEERRWYRYHHLFGDLLRQQLERRGSTEETQALHRRACDWFIENSLPDEALKHALAADDIDRGEAVVLTHAPGIFMVGDARTLLGWTESLPEAWLAERPATLGLVHIWALLMGLRWQEGQKWLDRYEPGLRALGSGELTAQLDGLRGHLARSGGDLGVAVELYQKVLESESEETLFVRGTTSFDLGVIYLSGDALDRAEACFEQSLRINQAAGHHLIVAWGLFYLSEVFGARAELHEALLRAEQAFPALRDCDEDMVFAMPYSAMAGVYREWNDLDRALELAEKACVAARRGGLPAIVFSCYLQLAQIRCSRGEFDPALAGLDELDRIAGQIRLPGMADVIMGQRSRFLLQRASVDSGVSLDAVDAWVEDVDLLALRDDPRKSFLPAEHRDAAHLAQVRIRLLRGETEKVLEVLGFLGVVAQQAGRNRSLIEIRLLEALAYRRQGEVELARMPFREALSMAEPSGFVRLFLDEGVNVRDLFADFLADAQTADDPLREYAARLLQALDAETPGRPLERQPRQSIVPSPPAEPPGEPISVREREVLNVIATGASNQQAARHLGISPATVKKHLENIYGKLGVHNRMEAVARARDLEQLEVG